LKFQKTGLLFIESFIERRLTDRYMKTQIIEKHGKKEFAVIPYKDFLRMQEELEDYHDILELRKAKAEPKNQRGRPFDAVAAELGLTKKKV